MTKSEIRKARQAQSATRRATGQTREQRQREYLARQVPVRRRTRSAKRECAYVEWCLTDDGPGDYEINGPDQERDL